MKLAIVGGRDFRSYGIMTEVLAGLNLNKDTVSAVICGGAVGADTMGSFWADHSGIAVVYFKPNWDRFGKAAGFTRNIEMAKEADKVVAFWNGFSPGTAHMVDVSRRMGKLLHVEEY